MNPSVFVKKKQYYCLKCKKQIEYVWVGPKNPNSMQCPHCHSMRDVVGLNHPFVKIYKKNSHYV